MDFELIFIGTAILALAAGWLIDRRSRLRPVKIDESGVLITRSVAKPTYLSWEEIESFGIASAARLEGGLHLGKR